MDLGATIVQAKYMSIAKMIGNANGAVLIIMAKDACIAQSKSIATEAARINVFGAAQLRWA